MSHSQYSETFLAQALMEDAVMAPLELVLSKLVVVLLHYLGDLVAPPSTHALTSLSLSLALPPYYVLE